MTAAGQQHGRQLLMYPSSPSPTRLAFPLRTRTIAVSVPAQVPGSYVLIDSAGRPIYVGRSDRCLRRRLLGHPLRTTATHFSAAVTDSPRGAYLLECYWWHRYRRDDVLLLNRIHPAAADATTSCPFCSSSAATSA